MTDNNVLTQTRESPATLAENLVRSIVDRPELVRVTSEQLDNRLNIEVHLHRDDASLLVGRILKSLQTVLAGCAAKHGVRFGTLKITAVAEAGLAGRRKPTGHSQA